MGTPAGRDLLTPKEVSEILATPIGSLAQWRSADRGPAYFKLGASVRYHRSDVEAWIEEQRQATQKGGAPVLAAKPTKP